MKKGLLFSAALILVITMAVMPASSLAKDPIKIGFFAPLTGFAAQTGKDMLNGLKFYLDEQKYMAGDRKIELFIEDTEAKPAVARPAKSRSILGSRYSAAVAARHAGNKIAAAVVE